MSEIVGLANLCGRWLVAHLGSLSLELAVLTVVVFAVIRLLRIRSAALRHLFWGLVLAKPVVTFLIASPLSLYWFLRPPVIPSSPPLVAIVREARVLPARTAPSRAYARPQVAALPEVRVQSSWRRLDRYGAVGAVWALCACGFALRLAVGLVYLAHLRRTAALRPRGDELAAMVDDLRRDLRLRQRVRIAVTGGTHGPVLAGCLRPLILLPRRLVEAMPPERLRLILAHELAHVRRCDNTVLLVQRLAEMLLFFHPAVWFCGWSMRREAEAACDDLVITACGQAEEYADSLTRVAEMRDGLTSRLLISTFAAAESNLARRVRRILRQRVGPATATLTMVALAALIAIGCLGLPTAAERKHKPISTEKTKQDEASNDMVLGGRTYRLEWMDPARLRELRLAGDNQVEMRTPDQPYAGHVHPLYNIHCEVGTNRPPREIEKQLSEEGRKWPDYWQSLARGLDSAPFALVAFDNGKLAGYVRFFPANVAHLRWASPAQSGEERDVLLIGAGFVDSTGVEHGLDGELLRRVIRHARQHGYRAIRALAWSNVRPYAMWGESFPLSIYEAAGFRRTAKIAGDRRAFSDMLAGAHGEAVQKLVKSAVADGTTVEKANDLFVVEKGLGQEADSAAADGGLKAKTRELPKSASLKGVPGGNASWNAFAGGLTIALNYTGAQTDHDTVMGDLGLAFICQASDQATRYDGALDAGWWPLAWDCLPTLLERTSPAFGIRFVWLEGDYEQYKANPRQCFRDTIEHGLKSSVVGGRPVLANHGGWQVVVGYDEQEFPLMSFCPRGEQRIGRLDKHPILAVTLGEAVPRMSREAADIAALKQAVALHRDRIPMPNGYLTGGKAMALWATCLRDTNHLGEARWHANVVHNLILNRRSAVAYLRSMAKRRPKETAAHLDVAADRYEAVIAALQKCDTSDAALVNPANGRETLAKLVESVAATEVQAIAGIENALAAEGVKVGQMFPEDGAVGKGVEPIAQAIGREGAMKAKAVRHEGNRVWVENLQHPTGANSVLASLTVVLRALGEDVTYEDLMGLSSQAFRLQFDWCPSAPHAHIGFNTFEPALRATGYTATPHALAVWEPETRKQREATKKELTAARTAVRQAIDAGAPVLFNSEEGGVLAGYEPVDEGHPTGWLALPGPLGLVPGDAPYVSAVKQLPWDVCIIGKAASNPPGRRESIVWSLRTAVRNAHTPSVGDCPMGFAAWDRWVRELDDLRPVIGKTQELLDKYDTGENAPAGIQLGNAWCYESLIDARKAAARYLETVAPEFGDRAAKHLRTAATEYASLVTALTDGARDCSTIAPYPWQEQQPWTDALRAAQARRLRMALEHERAAIAAIEKALAAEGVIVSDLAASGGSGPDNTPSGVVDADQDDRKRLLRWQNIFGWSLEKCNQGAAEHPEVVELNDMEKTLAPLSTSAENIRREMMNLEPATLDYWPRVEAIVRAIGGGGNVTIENSGLLERTKTISLKRQALEIWLAGAQPARDAEKELADAARAIDMTLGKPDDTKTALVRLTVERMERGKVNEADAESLRKQGEDPKELVYRIEHLDAPLWDYERNFDQLMRGIAAGKAIGKYNEPDGPHCWVTGNPKDRPKVTAAIEALAAWVDGRESGHEFVRLLNAGPANDEKTWLVRSLLVYLTDHAANYYGPIDRKEAGMSSNVKREGGKVWIAGVKGFDPGEYVDSVHGSQARILQALGEPMTYADLICYSGFSFRIGVHNKMCPSGGHPWCGYECIDNGIRALPWRTKVYEGTRWKNPGPGPERAAFEAEVCAAVKASIDRGIPVHYGCEEDGLIIGYCDDGRRWWCVHPYYKNGGEAFWHDEVQGFAGGKWPWGIVVWTEPKSDAERVTGRELTLAALRQAVEMWQTEKRGEYFCGETAYTQWLNWLRAVDTGREKDPKAGMQGNGWCYNVLEHSRGIAGRWLKQHADDFKGATRECLLAAAEHYTRIQALCMQDLGCPWSLALPPEKLDQWTPDMRRTQIQRLEAAREHDRAAIAEIEKALKAEGNRLENAENIVKSGIAQAEL
ncbi:MAG: M56 family metallopeptidase [Kiritimatiellae bacterium]|nr:M56 family metallopeptidase [Kiritimatiellia bacterium]